MPAIQNAFDPFVDHNKWPASPPQMTPKANKINITSACFVVLAARNHSLIVCLPVLARNTSQTTADAKDNPRRTPKEAST